MIYKSIKLYQQGSALMAECYPEEGPVFPPQEYINNLPKYGLRERAEKIQDWQASKVIYEVREEDSEAFKQWYVNYAVSTRIADLSCYWLPSELISQLELIDGKIGVRKEEKPETIWHSYKNPPQKSGLFLGRVGTTLEPYIVYYRDDRRLYEVWGLGRREPVTDMDVVLWTDVPTLGVCVECKKEEAVMDYGQLHLVCGPCFEKLENQNTTL